MIIAGPSSSGKTSLVHKMINNPECFDRPPTNVIIAYSRMQSVYKHMMEKSKIPIRLIEGLPENLKTSPGTLLIIDDLQNEAGKAVCDWFIRNAHHSSTSVIYLCQNIFLKSPEHRTASLNAHYVVLFKNVRDKTQIINLARQFSPYNSGYVIDAFKQATAKPHGYLMLDFKQETDDLLRLRDSVFPDTHVFVDKKIGTPLDMVSLGLASG